MIESELPTLADATILTFTNVLLHAIPSIIAGFFAAIGAYFTIKYSVRYHAHKLINHDDRIGDLENHSEWHTRRIDKIFTVHKMRHPDDDLSVPQVVRRAPYHGDDKKD